MHQQQRSFFRANRPGNLNIVDINESLNQVQIQHSPLVNQQQQQQQMLMPPSSPYTTQTYSMNKVHQSPLLGPPPLPPPPPPSQSQSSYSMSMSTSNQQNNYIPPPISPAAHFNQKIQQQQQHPPPSPSYMVQTNTSNTNKSVNNFQPPYSPSYSSNNPQTPNHQHLYNTNTNTNKTYEQQSYTPTYSPIQSSANLISKQTQYFNFDIPNASNSNNSNTSVQSTIPQSPRLLTNPTNASTNLYQQQQQTKLASNNTSLNQGQQQTNTMTNTNSTVTNTPNNRYTQHNMSSNGTYQNPSNFSSNNSNAYQFQHNYHKMPSTPQSAIPISNNNNHLFTHNNHSLSVPNSPLINNNLNNNNNTSMFQFNVTAQQHLQASLQDTTPSVLKFRENDTLDKQDKLDVSYEDADVDDDEDEDDEATQQIIEETKTKTYGESEIEMVEQVLNDMMQKEESIKDNISSNSVDSTANCEISNTNTEQIMLKNEAPVVIQSSETTNAVMHDHYNQFEQTQQQQQKHLNDSNEPMNMILNRENDKIMNQNKLDNIKPTSITNSSNSDISASTSASNKTPMYSLSNLSAAASAEFEFMLNYNSNESNKERGVDNENFNKNLNKNNSLSLMNTASSNKNHNDSFKIKQFSDSTSEFHKQFSLNNNNKKSDSIDFGTNLIKKETNKYDNQMKMSIDNPYSSHSNEHSHSFSNLKQSMDRDINFKFSVLDQQNLMNSSLSKRSNPPSVHSDDFSSMSNPSMSSNSSNIQNCADCGKTFTNKSALAKHRLIHSNERKYACHLCDKSFKRQDHLNGHLLTHQDKKPFECKAPGCDKSYCDSRSLKRHVESQHQDYLEAVARGNHEVLNYLPNIGKLKANLAPNLHHEIIVNEPTTSSSSMDRLQYSPITPVINLGDHHQEPVIGINNRPKNFFTFEEPKPETCRICGKGFKNIPALNGHMRLHGGFIKTKANPKSNNNLKSTNDQLMNINLINTTSSTTITTTSTTNDPYNEDSMSSNCSSTNSFSNSFQSINDLKNSKDSNNNIKQMDMNETNLTDHYKPTSSYSTFNQSNSNINNMNKTKTISSKPKNTQKTILQKLAQRNLLRKLDNSSFRAYDMNSKSIDDSHYNNDLSEEYDNDSEQQHHSISNQHDTYSYNFASNNSHDETRLKSNNMFYDDKLNQSNDSISEIETGKKLFNSNFSKIKAHSIDSSDDLMTNSTNKFISNLLQQKQNSFDSFMPPTTISNNSTISSVSSSFNPPSKSFLPTTSTSVSNNLSQRLYQSQNTQKETNSNANNSKIDDFNSYKHIYSQSEPSNLYNQSWSLPQNVMKSKVDCLASTNPAASTSVYNTPNEMTTQLNSTNSTTSLNSSTTSSSTNINSSNSTSANKNFNSINNTKSFVPYTSNTSSMNETNYESQNKKTNEDTSYTILRDAINNAMRNHQLDSNSNQSNQIQSPNNNNNSKQKIKPGPLIIPSAISAFQQQNQLNNYIQQQQNQLLLSQNAYAAVYAAAMAAHIYPNATLLKSPRVFNDYNSIEYNFNYKKQYTPPPMLSPFRKGPGLFCNSKPFASFFSAPQHLYSFQSQQHQIRPTPQYNHSISDNHLTMSYLSNYHSQLNNESNFNDKIKTDDSNLNENNIDKQSDSDDKSIIKVDDSDSDDPKSPDDEANKTGGKPPLLNSSSYLLSKPTLKRSRITSQNSFEQLIEDKELTDEAKAATETIAAALNDLSETNIKPFINEGDEFQATIPKLRNIASDYPEEKENLMCSADSLGKILSSEQFDSYLQMITKSGLVYGSSNNLELGLHILQYYNGNFEKAIKTFLDDSIDLPSDHPISTYKYNETDIWTQNEIKCFEKAILKYDKNFSEISTEIQTKTTKQCIEFYYLWKKVMSDGMKKKWRSLRKNRSLANPAAFESANQNEGSTTTESTEDNQVESQLHDKTNNNQVNKEQDTKTNSSSRSSNVKSTDRFECIKCNLIFKTKRKLKTHQSQKHNTKK